MSQMDDPLVSQILKSTLLPKHLVDPYVIRFIGNFISCREVKQAAMLSNLTPKDGRILLGKPDIHKAIQMITEKAVARFGFDADEVVERVKELAFSDPADLFDPTGRIYENIHDIPPDARRAIKKFKYKSYFEDDVNGVPQYKGRVYEVEMWGKEKPLEMLASEKQVMKKTTVVEHDVSRNAAAFLLGSVAMAEARKSEMAGHIKGAIPERVRDVVDVTPVESGLVPIPNPEGNPLITKYNGFTKPPGVG